MFTPKGISVRDLVAAKLQPPRLTLPLRPNMKNTATAKTAKSTAPVDLKDSFLRQQKQFLFQVIMNY